MTSAGIITLVQQALHPLCDHCYSGVIFLFTNNLPVFSGLGTQQKALSEIEND